MSSPIQHADDVDAALVYAPPWARQRNHPSPDADAAPRRSLLPWRDGKPDAPMSTDLMAKLQRQMALAPDKVPEPPIADEQGLPWAAVLRVGSAVGLAAAVAWGAVSLPGLRAPHSAPPPAGDAAAMTADASAPDALATPEAARLLVERGLAYAAMPTADAVDATPLQPQPVKVEMVKAESSSTAQVAALGPAVDAPAPARADNSLQLGADEIATLIKRGKDAFNSGDIASARLLLRRAADAGNGEAAMVLGATFDPLTLRRLGAIGAAPDPAQARQWYQRAVALGAAAAAESLAKLDAGGR